jgi:hypothetical protein
MSQTFPPTLLTQLQIRGCFIWIHTKYKQLQEFEEAMNEISGVIPQVVDHLRCPYPPIIRETNAEIITKELSKTQHKLQRTGLL